jgi:hypothetical protein
MQKALMSLAVVALLSGAAHAEDAGAPKKPARSAKAAKASAQPATQVTKSPMAIDISSARWVSLPGGTQSAPLGGDITKGPYGAFRKFGAGTTNALHTHSYDLRMIVISGTLLGGVKESAEKEYGPGTYLFLPAGMKHITGCKAGADCFIYQEGKGPFDSKPVVATR